MPAMHRQRVSTGTIWERTVGYSRAIRVGPFVHVTGTLAVDDEGRLVGPGDAAKQAEAIFDRIEWALDQCGSRMDEVVRCRIYVMDIADQQAIGAVHHRRLGAALPATTMVQVSGLALEGALVEIEAEAIIGDGSTPRPAID